jgi:hypothetical protein
VRVEDQEVVAHIQEEELGKEAVEETEETLTLEDHHQEEIALVHQEEVLVQKVVEEDLHLKENLMLQQKGKEKTSFSSFLLQNL